MSADLRYPVGRLMVVLPSTDAVRLASIGDIAALPVRMREAVDGLGDAQLDTPYRPGGWTVRQVVHHVPDSHMNAYIRLKVALTENTPTIKPYDEKTWAELADSRMPIEVSLGLLDGIHARWVALLRVMKPEDWARTFNHPGVPGGAANARLAPAGVRLALAAPRRAYHVTAAAPRLACQAVARCVSTSEGWLAKP